ncbi:ParB N-terminal domain-containing protein [Nocardia sp. NPDC046473]|uniref:ParB/RepB/Spo0J family partition protein n=1 Tax=Nocardia sp. NPDC046473 TaxID=3155733 RepID=UPI0033D7EE89
MESGQELGKPVLISISRLRPADSPRLSGEDPEHIRILTEAGSDAPPILVHRETMRVIDGMHRLRAAMARGDEEIIARFFEGDADTAFVLAVQANINHGLPLSFADRAAAARRIMISHPNWSDRAIAKTAGISPKSVSKVRARVLGEPSQVVERVGADGRERPPNSSPEGRLRAAELLAKSPDASLREIAKAAAISVSTVNDVRKRLDRGEDPVLPSQRGAGERTRSAPAMPNPCRAKRLEALPKSGVTMLHELKRDPSLRFSEPGRHLLRTLHETFASATKWPELIGTVPDHQAHVVAELAEHFADQWREFADRIRSNASSGVQED